MTGSESASDVVGRNGLPELLLGRGLISRDDLAAAERRAKAEQQDLTESIVALGFVTETDAFEALAEACSAPYITLDDVVPSELAIRLVPEPLARHYQVMPLSVDDGTLTYATCRPFDADAGRDVTSTSGRPTC